jgi:putative FmdB family regulatory protein
MPTYEYVCRNCGNQVEVFQRIADDPLSVCEMCGGPLRKVFHPAGILFKGSGFYKTDSRAAAASGNGKKGAGTTASERAKSGTDSSGSSEKASPSKSESAPKETSG